MSAPAATTSPLILPSPVGHISEFAGGYTGTCGPTAVSVAIGASKGDVISEQYMVALAQKMIAEKIADPNGATTIGELQTIANQYGVPTEHFEQYSEPFPFDWISYLRTNAGRVPIVLEFANGQALRDVETGVGENATNLHYHYVCVVGKQDDGYIVADGDNFQVLQRFEIYDLGTLTTAKPCALLALKMARTAAPPASGVPAGWTDDGKTLHNPVNSFVVVNGIRDFVLANHWDPADVPLNNEAPRNPVEYGNPQLGEGAVQYFRASGQVTWTKSNNTVFRTWNGQEMLALLALIGSLTASVRTDQALIGTLQQQVDALKAQHSASDDAIKAMATALSAFPVQK